MRAILAFAAFMTMVGVAGAQEVTVPNPVKAHISLQFEWRVWNSASRNIRSLMRRYDFDQPTTCWFFCTGTISHPKTTGTVGVMLDIDFHFKHRQYIGGMAGVSNVFEVSGYHLDYGYLILSHRNKIFAPFMRWYDAAGQYSFFVGPSINYVHVYEGYLSDRPIITDVSTVKPGIVFGGEMAFVNRRIWFLAVNTRVHLAPGVDIGPYATRQSGPDNFVVPKSKMQLSNLQMGLTAGFKCRERVNRSSPDSN